MITIALYSIAVLDVGMFLSVLFMHAVHKTSLFLGAYVVQSLLVACYFVLAAREGHDPLLWAVVGVTVLVKAVVVPWLYLRATRRLDARFVSDTYLDTPWTIAVLVVIAVLAVSVVRTSVPDILFSTTSSTLGYAPLHLAGILTALFLAVNRKGALSQAIALLALENWVVFVASRAGLHQTLALELAIMLEAVVLVFTTIFFMTMVHQRFGSLDISKLTHLSERDGSETHL